MSALHSLHNRIDLVHLPFTDRGSRLLMFRKGYELSIRLAERWTKWEKEYGHYRQRAPIIEHFSFLDMDGHVQDFETDTFPHVIRLGTTDGGRFAWSFIDAETLVLRLPSGCFGLQFDVLAEEGQADRRGGVFRGRRNTAYTTNARLLRNTVSPTENHHFQVEMLIEADDGDALVLNITPRLAFSRSVPDPDAAITDAHERWKCWFDAAPPVLEQYQKQYDYAWWVMGEGLLNTRYFFTREAMAPSKIHYVGVWQWDQFFHALAYRHVNTRLAEDQIRIVLDHQRADGMLPDAIHDEGLVTHLNYPVDADVTKPPLVAWTALKLYETCRHLDFLEEIYEPLCRWHNWWLTASVNENGLSEYRHPFSSGLDDSPLWDDGMPVVSPDLNTYLCIQQESLARIADLIGLPDDAASYREGADRMAQQMMELLWSEEKGYFQATHDGQPVSVFTPFNLLPLWTTRLPERVVQRLIDHLTNPAHFWTEWPIPTVAVSDPKFDAMQMWRGPTWPNINYLFIEALCRNNQPELARQLRLKTLDLLMRHNDIYEYYNPLTGERPPKSAPIYGWSAAVFIDLAIQETAWVESNS